MGFKQQRHLRKDQILFRMVRKKPLHPLRNCRMRNTVQQLALFFITENDRRQFPAVDLAELIENGVPERIHNLLIARIGGAVENAGIAVTVKNTVSLSPEQNGDRRLSGCDGSCYSDFFHSVQFAFWQCGQ